MKGSILELYRLHINVMNVSEYMQLLITTDGHSIIELMPVKCFNYMKESILMITAWYVYII